MIIQRKNAIKWKPENVINLHEDDLMSYRGDMDNNGIKDLNKFIQESPPHEKTYSTFYIVFIHYQNHYQNHLIVVVQENRFIL